MVDAGEVSPDGVNSPPTVASGDLPATLLDACRRSVLIAWDIETSGLDWRQAQIGTCQLFAPGIGAVVISVSDGVRPTRLVSLLEDPRVPKVFHHAPFDLRFMMHAWGVKPASIRARKWPLNCSNPRPRTMYTAFRVWWRDIWGLNCRRERSARATGPPAACRRNKSSTQQPTSSTCQRCWHHLAPDSRRSTLAGSMTGAVISCLPERPLS